MIISLSFVSLQVLLDVLPLVMCPSTSLDANLLCIHLQSS